MDATNYKDRRKFARWEFSLRPRRIASLLRAVEGVSEARVRYMAWTES